MKIAVRYGLSALSACLCAVSARAIDNTNISGITWAHTYEGDVLPSANQPALTESGTFGGKTDGNILTITNGYAEVTGGVGNPNWDGSSSSGTTFEVRMRVTSETGLLWGGFFGVGNQTGFAGLGVATNYVQVVGGGGNAIFYLDATVFHTYRMTISNDFFRYYVDSDPTEHGSFVLSGGAANSFNIGYGSGAAAGASEYDFVRWTNAGAFAVPEPGAASLATAAVLLGLVARRRRG